MSKVVVVTDSTASLAAEVAAARGIGSCRCRS